MQKELWMILHFLSIFGFAQGQNSGCEAAEQISGVTFSSKDLSCADVSFSSPGSTSGKFWDNGMNYCFEFISLWKQNPSI